ncbi:MAG: trypsin-like peptidase domain-containing protein [bacterium]
MNILHALTATLLSVLLSITMTVGAFFATTIPQIAHQTLPTPTTTRKTPTDIFPFAQDIKTLTEASSTKQSDTKIVKISNTLPIKPPLKTPGSAPISSQTKTPNQLNTLTRAALVNILCTTRAGGSFNPLSGSGILITGNGVILTNAHVAEYLLLRDYPTPGNTDCVVRMGSPAEPLYRASLLYLPSEWMETNAKKIATEGATSTGENDYAFLLITSTTNGGPLPTPPAGGFPFVPITTDQPAPKDAAFIAAYPAQYLGGIEIQKNLYASSVYSTVQELFGFQETNPSVDLFSLAGSVVSQTGSSGGAVARPQDGTLEGIVATEGEGATTADRTLYAITLGHIDRSLKASGHGGIIPLLSGDVGQKVLDFNTNIAPSLTKKLVDVLDK